MIICKVFAFSHIHEILATWQPQIPFYPFECDHSSYAILVQQISTLKLSGHTAMPGKNHARICSGLAYAVVVLELGRHCACRIFKAKRIPKGITLAAFVFYL